MGSGDAITAFVLTITGPGTAYLGYRIRADERTDLVFAPGTDAPDERVARFGGGATVLAGAATLGLGIAVTVDLATGGIGRCCSARTPSSVWESRQEPGGGSAVAATADRRGPRSSS